MKSTVFTNADFILSFEPVRHAEAMLVQDGIVRRTGDRDDVMEAAPEDAEIVDLGGRVVMPGFSDAHMHLDNLGQYINEIDLTGVSSIAELQSSIRGSHGPTGWVLGHGWDEHRFSEGRMPTVSDIDVVESERPVYLSRIDLHSAVLNTKAINVLDLRDKFHRNVDLIKDEKGLTGIVRESVFSYVDNAIKEKCSEDDECTMIRDAIEEAARQGVTEVGFMSASLSALKHLERLRKEGSLKIRVNVYISASEIDNYKGFDNDA